MTATKFTARDLKAALTAAGITRSRVRTTGNTVTGTTANPDDLPKLAAAAPALAAQGLRVVVTSYDGCGCLISGLVMAAGPGRVEERGIKSPIHTCPDQRAEVA